MECRDELSGAVYREAFDGVDDGFVVLDPDIGRIVDVNGAFVGTENAGLAGPNR